MITLTAAYLCSGAGIHDGVLDTRNGGLLLRTSSTYPAPLECYFALMLQTEIFPSVPTEYLLEVTCFDDAGVALFGQSTKLDFPQDNRGPRNYPHVIDFRKQSLPRQGTYFFETAIDGTVVGRSAMIAATPEEAASLGSEGSSEVIAPPSRGLPAVRARVDKSLTRVPEEELMRHVQEQRDFLETSTQAFDRGKVAEAKRIATTLRVLLHTGRHRGKDAPPLFKLLVDLPNQLFPCVNTIRPDNSNVDDAMHLYRFNGSKLEALTSMSARTARFSDWWVEPCDIYRDITVTRRSAVLDLANRGGGAHVDPDDSNDYRQFAELGSIGWRTFTFGEPASDRLDPVLNNPLPVIVRAAAAEVLAYLSRWGLPL